MSWADSRLEDDVQLYTMHRIKEDGTDEITGYAYGAPWVAQAMWMGDILFKSPKEAEAWWNRRYGCSV